MGGHSADQRARLKLQRKGRPVTYTKWTPSGFKTFPGWDSGDDPAPPRDQEYRTGRIGSGWFTVLILTNFITGSIALAGIIRAACGN